MHWMKSFKQSYCDIMWPKKRKKSEFNFDIESFREMIEEIIEEMKEGLESGEVPEKDNPLVFGFSFKVDQEGEPTIEEFGNIKSKDGKTVVNTEREPLVNILEEKNNIILTVELPGVQKENIVVETIDPYTIEIRTNNSEKNFYKKVSLHGPVKKSKSKASFNNGILEIVFQKQKNDKNSQIKVE